MYGWQEPKDGKRIYLVSDNTRMENFQLHIQEKDRGIFRVSSENPRKNLGIHIYRGELYSSNFTGICRIKGDDGRELRDMDGNELLLKVIPRFGVSIVKLLNYIRTDDEFDRYLAPQTNSSRHHDRDIESVDKNEIFYFFENEKPLKVDDGISMENSIITVTVFLNLLKALCKRPLMGRMLRNETNLTGKVRGKIVIGKNIKSNTVRGRNDRFYCQYLEYTDNILENQILKAALKKAKRFVNRYFGAYAKDSNNYTSMISHCSNALKKVDDIKCTGQDCIGLRFTGCYVYYKPVMALAQMVLDDISVDSNGEIGTSGYIMPYAVSMEKLFEVYVRAYLKRNGIKSYREQSDSGIRLEKFDEKIEVLLKEGKLANPGKYISGCIKPDIILTDLATGKKAVYDVKYKDFKKGDPRNDRLQLLAYSMMLNADNIGIVFPSVRDADIFDARHVNSREDRSVRYHQLLLDMTGTDGNVAEYIIKHSFDDGKEIS